MATSFRSLAEVRCSGYWVLLSAAYFLRQSPPRTGEFTLSLTKMWGSSCSTPTVLRALLRTSIDAAMLGVRSTETFLPNLPRTSIVVHILARCCSSGVRLSPTSASIKLNFSCSKAILACSVSQFIFSKANSLSTLNFQLQKPVL
ncbi:hypothetical protein ANANG_G00160760 [Anguilla anguilla]|uniref:Uncharacterized protein n=1 Tax=Anguilla anguilla TaxID=7936 RepID=A0A9D3M885_ANGAN|nr:hypothetical protein ANANG_G00160760 [Anguilla anguilla]